MLAVRIHQYGSRKELSLDDVPVPQANPDELLVTVVAGECARKIVLLAGTP